MALAKTVYYCRICSTPPEFCEFLPSAERCKKTLQQDNPELYAQLHEPSLTEAAASNEAPSLDAQISAQLHEKLDLAGPPAAPEGTEDGDKKHQSRGGKGLMRDDATKLEKEAAKRAKARLQIKRTDRNKRKAVTHIRNLELFGLDLKKVAKRLAGKYACGASVVKDNNGKELVDVQGDFVDDLLDFLPKEYPEIKADQIDVIEK